MDIEVVVIHEIKKVEQTTGADLFLTSNGLDASNEKVKEILETLDSAFTKKTIRRARFSDDGFKEVIPDFESFDMISASKQLAIKLKDGIQNIPAAKGGYLIFCKYKSARKYFSVFFVRNTLGSLLKQSDDNSWDVESIFYLDLDHFAMGVRVNLDILQSGSDDRYIHLVKGNTDISDYFENWVGVDDTKRESKDGEALYIVSNQISLPEGVEDRDEFKKQIYDYINGRSSKVVNLKELSSYLFGDSEVITNYCDENELDIDGEFKVSAAQLKKFMKISVVAGGIKLEAARDKFSSDGISVSPDGLIVTIKSKQLADAIKENL